MNWTLLIEKKWLSSKSFFKRHFWMVSSNRLFSSMVFLSLTQSLCRLPQFFSFLWSHLLNVFSRCHTFMYCCTREVFRCSHCVMQSWCWPQSCWQIWTNSSQGRAGIYGCIGGFYCYSDTLPSAIWTSFDTVLQRFWILCKNANFSKKPKCAKSLWGFCERLFCSN